MIKTLLSLGLMFSLLVSPLMVDAAVKVNGYFRKDGTYVKPHYRSNPDGNPYNNYSFPGNTNPYTGVVAPGNSQTYLNNYYSTGATAPTGSYTSGTTLPVYSSSVQVKAPKYASLASAPKWVEYVGQDDRCAHVYDTYGQSLARLKTQYSRAPSSALYVDRSEYTAAVTSYNFNAAKVDRDIELLWAQADQSAYSCYQASTTPIITAAVAQGSEPTLATIIELFIAMGIIPSEKAEQARTVVQHSAVR